jgi:sugar (pentulose or hexulose) kinase
MTSTRDLFAGIDIGTSGVRAVCADSSMAVCASASVTFKEIGGQRRDPNRWTVAVQKVLGEVIDRVPDGAIKAISIDGTSGTLLVTDAQSRPLGLAMMYNDVCEDQTVLEQISAVAPRNSAAHGASSGLAKAILLARTSGCARIQHEADWITSCLSGMPGISDQNNALKTGYDPVSQSWPAWIDDAGLDRELLPSVLQAGEPISIASGRLARQAGLGDDVLVVAGTTDGCASFLATGAASPGDCVTVLGSTLTLKLLSDTPIYAPEFGIYSHRIGDLWLAGGASNTGGKVLEHFFSQTQLDELSATIDTNTKSGLDYYPLVTPGERFPINDSNLEPRLQPRPASDAQFLHGMLEGIGAVEKLAYDRLVELGAPLPQSIRTVGGGANNDAWTAIRKSLLQIPFWECLSTHAATGAAVLARQGAIKAGIV